MRCARSFKKVGWTMGLEPHFGDSPDPDRLPDDLRVTDREHNQSIPAASTTRDVLRVTYVSGVDDGTRTHDDRDHNPGLYQLSYAHLFASFLPNPPTKGRFSPAIFPRIVSRENLARPAGLEPATLGLAYQLPLSRPRRNEFVVWTISSPSQAPHV